MSGADTAPTSHDEQSHAPAHSAGDEGHHADAHSGDHGHGEALGPIDWRAWGAAVVGLVGGLLVIVALYATIKPA
jgi:hypothetical protein